MTPQHLSHKAVVRTRFPALITGIVGGLIVLLGAPLTAFAVDVVTAWTLPAPNTNYNFGTDVVLQGTWLLPADWVGNIYVYQDGIQMHDKSNPTANCNAAPAPTECYIAINNIGGATSLAGNFTFNIGPQPDGVHNIQVKFWGGAFCAVKWELNSMIPPPSPLYTGTCLPDETNFNAGQIYPLRSYTVNVPLYPRITVTPATLDFANVTTGGQSVKSFTVTNTGQQTLNFTVTGIAPPYYCVGGSCAQSVAMNQPKLVQIQFVPEAVASYPQTAVFTCTGAPLACDIPSISRPVTGSGVGAAAPPQVSVVSGASVNYGFFYFQNPVSVNRNVIIKNIGGGLLNGAISLPSAEYVCIGNCNYSIFAGDQITKTIKFTPGVPGMGRSDIASFSDAGAGTTASLLSDVSDTPVLDACVFNCVNPWSAGVVNINGHREIGVYVRNVGGGKLAGTISGLPDRGFSFTPNANYPYANITPAMSWVHIGKFNFDPSDPLPAAALATFSNDNPPGGNTDTINLVGQGNNLPIAGLSSPTVAFGPVVVNTTKQVTLVVTNTGVGILNVTLPFGVLGNPAFSCISNCVLNLGAASSSIITFSFTPTAQSPYSTVVNVGGINVTLSGTGILPAEKIYAQDTTGTWNLLPVAVPIEYGVTNYGSPVQDKLAWLQIQSTGGAGTRVNYSIDISAAPHFSCTVSCAGTVSADAGFNWWANAQIVFKPGNAPGGPGDYTETITVNYDFNDAIPRQRTYQVHGKSVATPYMTITPPSHSYTWAPTVVGNTPTTIFSVKNEGIGPMTGGVNVPVSGGIVGHWTFDAANMNFPGNQSFDSSVSAITGTLVGGPTGSAGYFDEALRVVPGQYVNLGAISTGFNLTDLTATAWVKTNANGEMILSYQNGNPLMYLSVGPTTAGGTANKFVAYLRTNGGGVAVFSSTKSVNDGAWHHVAIVRSAMTGKVKLYVDGLLDASYNWGDGGAISTSGGSHFIGYPGPNYTYSGDIDDVRVYSRTLSAQEISKLFLGQVVVYDPIFKCINPVPCTFNNLMPSDPAIPFTFSFAPADAYTYSSLPQFTSDGGNINVSLMGTGVFQPVIVLTPTTVTDPTTYVGPYNFHNVGTSNLGAFAEKNIRIWNVGRGPLDGTITFTIGTHFSCQPPTTGCSFSIPEGTYKDVTIRFAPLAVGGLDDTARFNSNAFNGLQTVQVHGTGIFASIINILGSGQNFPPTVIGKSKEQNITIRNTGTVDFGTGTFALSGPFTCVASSAGPLVGGLCPYNLVAGGSTVITVRFAPIVAGPVNGLVSLSTLPLANFFVNGTGITPMVKFIEN